MLTIETLREIAQESGLSHARFCTEQEATQRGRDNMRDIFTELERLEDAEQKAQELNGARNVCDPDLPKPARIP